MAYDRQTHAEAYRSLALDLWFEMPDETRLRIFEIADLIENPEGADQCPT